MYSTECNVKIEKKRILVLTDVGEEVDDEAALWMMLKVLDQNCIYEADVVFCTGDIMLRCNRWATVICDVNPLPSNGRVQYFKGNSTLRHVRHKIQVEESILKTTGLNNIPLYNGGLYDVVIQMSPLGDSESLLGVFENVKLCDGAVHGSYVLVGTEGSTNFDTNYPIHRLFKEHMMKEGFLMSCIAQENYAVWTPDHTYNMNDILKKYIYEDEWKKAIGRINPEAVNLFVRFRVNCKVNYDVIKKAFDNIEEKFKSDILFQDAITWFDNIFDIVYQKIKDGYIQISKTKDNNDYGLSLMGETIKGQSSKWINLLSLDTQEEFKKMFPDELLNASIEGTLEMCNINIVMGWALLQMSRRMAITWLYITTRCGIIPDLDSIIKYFEDSLNFNSFPKLPEYILPEAQNDVEFIQQCFMGNPEYDPSGMFVALALLAADPETRQQISQDLEIKKKLLNDIVRSKALGEAYNGKLSPENLLEILKTGQIKTDQIKTDTI